MIEMIDLDRKQEMNRVSADVHYQIAMGFDESDAEGTIKAMVEKYPNMVMKILGRSYIKHEATLDAIDTFLQDWRQI